MRVAVVENTEVSELGQVGVALAEAGAAIEIFRPWTGGPLPSGPEAFDGLVVLGGEQSALDDQAHPYLPDLAALMRRFGDAGKAVLGICLGSQLLARGYGGENLLGRTPEFGWQAIALTEAGQADPVLAAATENFRIFQWHSDTFTLPPDAVHLAGNETAAHQAFRIGRAAYGTQFHFEANRAVVTKWREQFPHLIEKIDPDWLRHHPEHEARHGEAADAAGLALARAWVATIMVEEQPAELLAGE